MMFTCSQSVPCPTLIRPRFPSTFLCLTQEQFRCNDAFHNGEKSIRGVPYIADRLWPKSNNLRVHTFPAWMSYVKGCPRVPDQGCPRVLETDFSDLKLIGRLSQSPGAPECRSPRGTDRTWMWKAVPENKIRSPREQDPESQRHRQDLNEL